MNRYTVRMNRSDGGYVERTEVSAHDPADAASEFCRDLQDETHEFEEGKPVRVLVDGKPFIVTPQAVKVTYSFEVEPTPD